MPKTAHNFVLVLTFVNDSVVSNFVVGDNKDAGKCIDNVGLESLLLSSGVCTMLILKK